MFSSHFRGSYWNVLGVQLSVATCWVMSEWYHALIKWFVWSFRRQYLAIVPFSVMLLRALQPYLCQQVVRLESHSTKPKTCLSLIDYWLKTGIGKKQQKPYFSEEVHNTNRNSMFSPVIASWIARPFQSPIKSNFEQVLSCDSWGAGFSCFKAISYISRV